jgi:hypothetical protein
VRLRRPVSTKEFRLCMTVSVSAAFYILASKPSMAPLLPLDAFLALAMTLSFILAEEILRHFS